MTDTLEIEKRQGTGNYTRMTEIVVDGIVGKKPVTELYSKPIFTLKDEFITFTMDDDAAEYVSDTGEPYTYRSGNDINESHWFSCARVVATGDYCPLCGREAI